MAKRLFTIGYAGFPDINDFISALKENEIQILIDVRSTPYSAFYEVYNKDSISSVLKEHGIPTEDFGGKGFYKFVASVFLF